MAVSEFFWVALLLLSTAQLSLNLTDNRSDQDDFIVEGDCSIESCKNDQNIASIFAENTSPLVTFVATAKYNDNNILKFEYDYENSAMKQVTPSFDIKVLSVENEANQKCRYT